MPGRLPSKIKVMKKEILISSKKQYHETMAGIYELMNRGEENLTKTELKKVSVMSKAAEKYEDETLGLRPNYKPDNLPDMVKLVMLEKKISQGRLAEMLELGKPKLSQILNGKRKPDVEFLKLAYKKLKIDPAFILEHV
jgi:antitoxin component HigA of HigAB toxin-antitoxin module